MVSARAIFRQILGTLIALLAGWCAGLIVVEASTALELLRQPHYIVPSALIETPITMAWIFIYFTLPVWLLVLVPLYLFIPTSSVLWRWPVCTLCGAVAGYLILNLIFVILVRPSMYSLLTGPWSLYALAAIIGGITCLVGALTRRRFKQTI